MLSFTERSLLLEGCYLETDALAHPMTEEECRREVRAVAAECERRTGVVLEEKDYSQMRDKGKRGRVVTAWHGSVKLSAKEKLQYAIAGLRDEKGTCRLVLNVFITDNGSWCFFPDSFDEPSCLTIHY